MACFVAVWLLVAQVPAEDRPASAPTAAVSQPASAPNKPEPATPETIDKYAKYLLGNNELAVRRDGASYLLQSEAPEAIARLVTILGDAKDAAAQLAICEAVGRCDAPPAGLVSPIISMLGSSSQDLDSAARTALRRFENGIVISQLKGVIDDRAQSAARRLAAIHALGALGDHLPAVAALMSILESRQPATTDAVFAALREATGLNFEGPDAAVEWWGHASRLSETEWLREQNAKLHSRLRDTSNALDTVTRRLVDARREEHARAPEGDRPSLLLGYLKDPLPSIRELGLDLVNVRITDRKDVGPEIRAYLGMMIADRSAPARQKASKIVGDLRLAGEVDRMLAAMNAEKIPAVRAAQVAALGQLDGKNIVPALLSRLDDPSPLVVAETARALADLAHKTPDDRELTATIGNRLIDRFHQASSADEDLREAIISAMARVKFAPFDKVFHSEMGPDRTVRIRQAAVRGLAANGGDTAAVEIRSLLDSDEGRLRVAAADALGVCGQSEADLDAIARHLDNPAESDQTVRDRAWAAYGVITRRLPLDRQLDIAHRISASSASGPRRALDLLRGAESRFSELSDDRRAAACREIGQAHFALGEFKTAAGRFEQAARMLSDHASPQYGELAVDWVKALLRSGDDAPALALIHDLSSPDAGATTIGRWSAMVKEELNRRLAESDYDGVLRLSELAQSLRPDAPADFGPALDRMTEQARQQFDADRDKLVDRYLDVLTTDPEAERQLLTIGAPVLARVYRRLSAPPTTTASSDGAALQSVWISLARKIAPEWDGFSPDAGDSDRATAMEKLRVIAEASGGSPTTSESSSSPAAQADSSGSNSSTAPRPDGLPNNIQTPSPMPG